MRGRIIDAIHRRMAHDKALFFVTGDMGINLVEKIAETFPDRYLNVGIAEQNMIGICAGLVNGGFRPVAYTISNFAVHRCFEQIRNEIGIHEYPVLLLGTSTGFDNAPLGPTHHIVDDWGSLRAIPKIEIHCPSSVAYADKLLDRVLDRSVPAYIRIPKGDYALPASDEPVVYLPGQESELLLVTYGGLAQACLKAQATNPRLSVMIFNQLRPVDAETVAAIWANYQCLVVVEDHFPETGLYATACQIAAQHALTSRIMSRAPTAYYLQVGSGQEFFWKKFGADPETLGTADALLGEMLPLAPSMGSSARNQT